MAERILIVERSDGLRRSLRAPLEADGFVVAEAGEPDEALHRLRERRHDAVFVDVDASPDALDLVDAISTDPDLASTPIVLLTEDLADGVALEGIGRGASDALRKPIDPVEAIVRAAAAARLGQLQQRIREGDDRLTELAATDDLTGVLARKFLESHLRGLVAAASRHGKPLSVALFDVDNFKSINDAHGHAVGDFVLRTIVERMQSRLRKEDMLGRWGGEEFLTVFPDVDLDGALTAAEGVREAIEETAVSVDGERIPVTLSGGVAAWDSESDADLVERADAALYDAKQAGRNQIHGDRVPQRR